MKLLGLSASLRNLRSSKGSNIMVEELVNIHSRGHLTEYLSMQGQLSVNAFVEAGRKDEKPFDEIYSNLKKLQGKHGLSNSETVLAAGLWAAKQQGIEIEHISLSEYFGNKAVRKDKIDNLLAKVAEADGILISGPVYFGDRSSLAYDFIKLLQLNISSVKGKVYAGISVGAKRNGGQETCLIYQMMDLLNLGMFAVGNDTETTAQYGGTAHAGDVGTVAKDKYGINTSIGTGNRIAHAIQLLNYSKSLRLKDKPKVGIVILQDSHDRAKKLIKNLILDSKLSNKADFRFLYFVNELTKRCIACDICPYEIDDDKVYRCIIKSKSDLFVKYHQELIDLDAILIGGYSPKSFANFTSIYQAFIERTRYIRRGDYIYSNLLIAPIVFREIDSRENLEVRIATSMIRHHTILHRPIIFNVHGDNIIDLNSSYNSLEYFISQVSNITPGRIKYNSNLLHSTNYTPIGYTLSSVKDHEPDTVNKRSRALAMREKYFKQMMNNRVVKID